MNRCYKRQYRSKAAARKMLRQELSGTKYAAAKHPYLCPFCGWWHLTRQAQERKSR